MTSQGRWREHDDMTQLVDRAMSHRRETMVAAEHLAGKELYSWQRSLLLEHLLSGESPDPIDIPTGLGKTTVRTTRGRSSETY